MTSLCSSEDAVSLIATTHARILRELAVHTGRHFQGLGIASRDKQLHRMICYTLGTLDWNLDSVVGDPADGVSVDYTVAEMCMGKRIANPHRGAAS